MPKAIDIHVHPPGRPGSGQSGASTQMRQYFRGERTPTDPEEFYQYYKDRDLIAVMVATGNRNQPADEGGNQNDWVAELQRRHPETLLGFGGVDPHAGKDAVREARRCIEDLGLHGFKFHPVAQAFEANNPDFYALWQTISDLGVPALFHTGQTGVGAGTPGQNGIKNKYGRPYPYFDDLAADFPNFNIIMAHPSFPWVDEQLSVASLKTNVYVDLSGWSPKYFSANFIQYCNTLLQDRALWGSDYPALTPDRWLRDYETIPPFREAVAPKIFLENARKLLKLEF